MNKQISLRNPGKKNFYQTFKINNRNHLLNCSFKYFNKIEIPNNVIPLFPKVYRNNKRTIFLKQNPNLTLNEDISPKRKNDANNLLNSSFFPSPLHYPFNRNIYSLSKIKISRNETIKFDPIKLKIKEHQSKDRLHFLHSFLTIHHINSNKNRELKKVDKTAYYKEYKKENQEFQILFLRKNN